MEDTRKVAQVRQGHRGQKCPACICALLLHAVFVELGFGGYCWAAFTKSLGAFLRVSKIEGRRNKTVTAFWFHLQPEPP